MALTSETYVYGNFHSGYSVCLHTVFHLVQYMLPRPRIFFLIIHELYSTLSYPWAIYRRLYSMDAIPRRRYHAQIHRQRQRIHQGSRFMFTLTVPYMINPHRVPPFLWSLLSYCLLILFTIISLSQSSCVSLVELTDGKEGERGWAWSRITAHFLVFTSSIIRTNGSSQYT